MPAWRDWRLYLLVPIALTLMASAYQSRPPARIDVGALGDRAYLWASPLQEDHGFNGDEHLTAEGIDYRWTKRVSWVRFPDLAWNSPLQVQLRMRAWRPEGQPRPWVQVRVNGVPAGSFHASAEWGVLTFQFDEYPGHTSDLEVLVECQPFSMGAADKRFLGVQLDWVQAEVRPGGVFPVQPSWRQVLLWTAVVVLAWLALYRWLGRRTFWAGLALAVLIAVGLGLIRNRITPYAWWALYTSGALLLLSRADLLLRWLRRWDRRARSLPFFAALVGTGTVVVVGYVRWAVGAVPTLGPRPDATFLVIFVAAAVLYALLRLDRPLRRFLAWLDAQLRRPWVAGTILAVVLAGVTIHEFGLIRELQFIGHADYADNAVVARNLLAGRGFTVDYVTQFYRVYPDLSHPQETWPLLQPALIAPFFALLGDSPFAAKLPNLVLQLALALVLYAIATSLFDRRVGLVAAILTVMNRFIFRVIIFPTSDLGFTLLAMLTLAQFFRASEKERVGEFQIGYYAWAGVWAGLMMLAKPNGALFVGIALLWDLAWRWHEHRWKGWWQAWLAFGIPAAALFAPWVLRNLALFGAPIHSTEQVDAWILKYQDWEEIYRIYLEDLPDRSWLLRYGFDRVTEAIGTEFRRWWHYWSVDSVSLLTLSGSILTLVGVFALRCKGAGDRARAPLRLFSLVGAVLALFGTFICTYWHVEERYFVPFVPWLALLAARGLWWIHDTLAYRRDVRGRLVPSGFAWLGLAAVVWACLHMVAPFWKESAAKWQMDQDKRQELAAYAWLAEHSAADDVVMTRVPWQLTYYTGRRSVMIPQDGLQDTLRVGDMYGVDFLFMDGDARGKRPALQDALQNGGPWELLYDQGGVQIYRFGEGP